MFKNEQIKYLKIRGNGLFVKYRGEGSEEFLTNGKVSLKDWFKTQGSYYQKARNKTIEMAKSWKERHQRYLDYFKNKPIFKMKGRS